MPTTPPPKPIGLDDDLPLPDPYPEYVACPSCGEAEVEVWSDEPGAACPMCRAWVGRTDGDGRTAAARG